MASALQARRETVFKKLCCRQRLLSESPGADLALGFVTQDDDRQAYHTPDEEESNEATQSEYPHPAQVWRVPPQPFDEFILTIGQRRQHYQEPDVEKNVA